MNQGWTYREQIDPAAQGETVLAYYMQRYCHSSSAEWQQRIAAGQILLDGQSTTAQTRLKRGQWLTYQRPPWQEPEVPLDFDVIYEDTDVLVVNKPSGLPVLPGGGFLEHTLLHQLQQRYPDAPPVPIHRLGRGTSGLMLLARSPAARANLSQQMRHHQIRKTYHALVRRAAATMPNQFTITQPIGKIDYPGFGLLYAATPEGKSAQSDCRVLRHHPQNSWVEVVILTGRPHQIRIHLAAAGYPLWRDPLYKEGGVPNAPSVPQPGSTDNGRAAKGVPNKLPVPGDCGYSLCAVSLKFRHPQTGQLLSLSCPSPMEVSS